MREEEISGCQLFGGVFPGHETDLAGLQILHFQPGLRGGQYLQLITGLQGADGLGSLVVLVTFAAVSFLAVVFLAVDFVSFLAVAIPLFLLYKCRFNLIILSFFR